MRLLPLERAKEVAAIPLKDLRAEARHLEEKACGAGPAGHQFQRLPLERFETWYKVRCLVCGCKVYEDMQHRAPGVKK